MSSAKTTFAYSSTLVICVLLQFPWIFQGLDLTDYGLHLYNQEHAFAHPGPSQGMNLLWFLSDIIGAGWMSFWHCPSLIWARLGYLALVGANAVLCLRIVSRFCPVTRASIVVVMASIVASAPALMIIDYYTVPALLQNVLLLIVVETMWHPQGSAAFTFLSLGAGFVTASLVLSRLPLVALLAVPLAIYVYGRITAKELSKFHRAAQLATVGFVIGIASLLYLYHRLGVLGAFLAGVHDQVLASTRGTSGSHNMRRMLKWYVYEGTWLLAFSSIFAILWGLLLLARRKWNKRIPMWLPLFCLIVLWVGHDWRHPTRDHAIMVYLAIGYVLAGVGSFFWVYRAREGRVAVIFIASVFMMLVTPVGSDTGIYKMCYSVWVPLALSVLMFVKASGEGSSTRRSLFRTLGYGLVPIFFCMGIVYEWHGAYRDSDDRMKLNHPFESVGLEYIYSTPVRVRVVDEALRKITGLVKRGDVVLMENSIPMMYYLTQTTAFTGNPWGICGSVEGFKERIDRAIAGGQIPRLLVIARANVLNSQWPVVDEMCLEHDMEKVEYLRMRFLRDLGYTYLWSNDLVEVYMPRVPGWMPGSDYSSVPNDKCRLNPNDCATPVGGLGMAQVECGNELPRQGDPNESQSEGRPRSAVAGHSSLYAPNP